MLSLALKDVSHSIDELVQLPAKPYRDQLHCPASEIAEEMFFV
jgi:hypothetical protein